jgi:hypothetical protein
MYTTDTSIILHVRGLTFLLAVVQHRAVTAHRLATGAAEEGEALEQVLATGVLSPAQTAADLLQVEVHLATKYTTQMINIHKIK